MSFVRSVKPLHPQVLQEYRERVKRKEGRRGQYTTEFVRQSTVIVVFNHIDDGFSVYDPERAEEVRNGG